ncbi:MAG: pitrilysin family protein [Candidatus Falkowbacteria bacterium]
MYKTTVLSNGLKLITVPMEGALTVTALAMFATGSRYESREINGISHFLEHMFFKGTTKRPTTMDIASTLDNVGAEFNAFTSKEYTGYWVKAAGEHLELALDVVSDMLLGSKFAAEEMEREKGVIIEEINMYRDNPMWYIEEVYEELLYGDTPAGWDTAGTKEIVAAFTRDQLVAYWQEQYGTNSSCLILAGMIPENIQELAERYFAPMPQAAWKAKPTTVESQSEAAVKLFYKDTDQAHMILGVRSWGYANQNEYALKLLSLILGGSMSSRLFTELRERRGLAYYVSTSGENYTDSGYLSTRAGVPVDKAIESAEVIMTEYRRMKNELVSDEELSRVKNLLKGKIPLSLESSDEMAEWFARQDIMLRQTPNPSRGVITPQELLAEIDKVTAADIQKIAQQIFIPANLNLAIIGPYKEPQKFLDLLTI